MFDFVELKMLFFYVDWLVMPTVASIIWCRPKEQVSNDYVSITISYTVCDDISDKYFNVSQYIILSCPILLLCMYLSLDYYVVFIIHARRKLTWAVAGGLEQASMWEREEESAAIHAFHVFQDTCMTVAVDTANPNIIYFYLPQKTPDGRYDQFATCTVWAT